MLPRGAEQGRRAALWERQRGQENENLMADRLEESCCSEDLTSNGGRCSLTTSILASRSCNSGSSTSGSNDMQNAPPRAVCDGARQGSGLALSQDVVDKKAGTAACQAGAPFAPVTAHQPPLQLVNPHGPAFPRASPVSVLFGSAGGVFSPAEDRAGVLESPFQQFPLAPTQHHDQSALFLGVPSKQGLPQESVATPLGVAGAGSSSLQGSQDQSPTRSTAGPPPSLPSPASPMLRSQLSGPSPWTGEALQRPTASRSQPALATYAGDATTLGALSPPGPTAVLAIGSMPSPQAFAMHDFVPAPLPSPLLMRSPLPNGPALSPLTGSQSGSRISALLRQRLEQAKGLTRHAAPDCCSTPSPPQPLSLTQPQPPTSPGLDATSSSPCGAGGGAGAGAVAGAGAGAGAAFLELLEREAGRMRQRQEVGSPGLRDDPKRPKVAARSPQLGPRGTPGGGPSVQQPLDGAPAVPWRLRALQDLSASHEETVETGPTKLNFGNSSLQAPGPQLLADACTGAAVGTSAPLPPRPRASIESGLGGPGVAHGPRRTPSFNMLPPPAYPWVYGGASLGPPGYVYPGAGPGGSHRSTGGAAAEGGRGGALAESQSERGARDEEAADECADGVRRLVAIQEWEEEAVLGPPPVRRWPQDGLLLQNSLQLGPILAEPLLPHGPSRGDGEEGRGEEEEEDEEPATPMTPCSPTNEGLHAWPLDCPEAPNWRHHQMARCSSLKDTKLLLTTQLKRSHSVFLFDRHFDFLREVGRGSYSKVYEARDRRHGALCAIKVSRKEFRSKGDRERYLHEVESVAGLEEHPNVVKYYRCWQQDSHFYIQMELCGAGTLRTLMDAQARPLPEDQVWSLCKQLVAGLEHIHAAGVLHLDVKPENILIDNQGVLKIGDFGQAVMAERWDWEDGDGGYLAPELLAAPGGAERAAGDARPGSVAADTDAGDGSGPAPSGSPSAACDMFSFGALLYELATSLRLPRSRLRAAAKECRAGLERLGRSPSLISLIARLLDVDPAARPSASQVLAWDQPHPLPQPQPMDEGCPGLYNTGHAAAPAANSGSLEARMVGQNDGM